MVENRQTNKLLGIVTDRDLVLKVLAEGRDPKRTTVEEVMTRNPVVCYQEDNIVRALKSMGDSQVRRIPIVDDDNHIVGIIAQADVATRIAEPMKTAEVIKEISKSDSTEHSTM